MDGAPDGTRRKTCSHTTEDGAPCRVAPMVAGDRCHHHAGLPPTPAEQLASRTNAIKSGYFEKGLRGEEQVRKEDIQHRLRDDFEEAKRAFAAFAMVRAERVAAWEAGQENPSPLAAAALDSAGKALDKLRPVDRPGDQELDPVQVARVVEVLSAKPEVFLKRLKPEAQAEVRDVLRKWGMEA